MKNILIFNEFYHEKTMPECAAVYPKGIHAELASIFDSKEYVVTTVTQDMEDCGMTESLLAQTDCLIWWGHARHHEVSDRVTQMVCAAVLKGMGLICLHSAHMSKPFRALMGTSCSLQYREGDMENLWVIHPTHPIAHGVDACIAIPEEEMYGEYFDVPKPDDTIFLGWFAGGEVFRSGMTFTRGMGKIFYFQPGHETNPTYKIPMIRKILRQAADWVSTGLRADYTVCHWKEAEIKQK